MGPTPQDLAQFVASVGGEQKLRVEENLGAGFVRLRVSEAERRQAKDDIRCVEDAVIELLRNSRDAGARHIFLASSREGALRTLCVLDDGCGIPSELHGRVFEPRVTSKLDSLRDDRWGLHGRGMALYSLRQNAVSAQVMWSAPGKGCAIQAVFDASVLGERKDQSSWPSLGKDEEGERALVRGPHNIIRACCELALDEGGSCEVYVGSPVEMVATVRRRVRVGLGGAERMSQDLLQLGVLERLVMAADAKELVLAAASLGLELSERSAHRIVSGEVRPQRSVYSQLTGRTPKGRSGEVDLYRDARGLRLDDGDAAAFAQLMSRDFDFLAERYYVRLSTEPRLRLSHGRLIVSFDYVNED